MAAEQRPVSDPKPKDSPVRRTTTSMDEREVWWPPKRRLRLIVACVQMAAGLCSAALWFADGRLLGLLALAVGLCGAILALEAARSRVETSAEGIRVVRIFSSTFLRWQDVAELRPDAQAPWGGRLLVVTRDGDVVKLPLPPIDDLVQRWKQHAY